MSPHERAYAVYAAEDCERFAPPDWAYAAALRLIAQPSETAITSALSDIGTAAAADRAWMFEYDAALLRFRNTHEWIKGNVLPFVQDLQDTPVTMIAWLHRFLIAGKAVMIHRVEALPRSARPLQAEMLRQNDRSVLSVPVFHGGRLRACIGFDATAAPRSWSTGEIKAMFQCAGLIAAARYGADAAHSEARDAVSSASPLIYLRGQGALRGVTLEAIVGLRSSGDYTEVWQTDGSVTLDPRPLTQWIGIMPRALFLRVHRTAIVNLRHIGNAERRARGGWQVSMQHLDTAWPVSRTGWAELRSRLGI